ncbi:MAG: DUF2249 domain-containing protein [Gammaproteobacteria bacterium]|nr:DUF2249 domain-containing protein [Gammaproteobacteria bacterium]
MNIRSIDVRGLEAPEPLEVILENLKTLASDEQLQVTHWREPLLLYPILEQQGWRQNTYYDEKNQVYIITIRKQTA